MPLSRALKEVMRGSKGVSKKAVVTDSGKGSGMGMAKKQYNFPKDTAAVGPHYIQHDKNVNTKGILK